MLQAVLCCPPSLARPTEGSPWRMQLAASSRLTCKAELALDGTGGPYSEGPSKKVEDKGDYGWVAAEGSFFH